MARYNEILVGRYNRALQKLFGVKGEPPSPQLSGELQPNWQVFSGSEERYLQGWELFWQQQGLGAGGAGTFNGFRFRNPAGANVVCVIFKFGIVFGAPASTEQPIVTIGTAGADLSSQSNLTGSALDARGRPQPTAIISFQTIAAFPALTNSHQVFQFNYLTATAGIQDMILWEQQEIPVLPGSAVQVQNNNAVQPLTFFIGWRERFLEEGERF